MLPEVSTSSAAPQSASLSPGSASAQAYYQLSLPQADSDGFVAVATAVGDQAQDGACAQMQLRLSQTASITLTSGVAAQDDSARCWKQ